MKKIFETPELIAERFTVEDIITLSSEDVVETSPEDIRLPGVNFGS